ncbi:MAG: mandelate racemase [Acidobacteria bacterium]|nr:mandelate racemase [Acidobacteriota bacterium]
MISHPQLTIRSLRARAVNVPMARPLQTSGGTVGTAPLVLIDLEAEEGIIGSAYVFCYTPLALKPVAQLIANLETLIKGELLAPVALEQKLQRRLRLLGAQGLTGIAMAGIDMAAWDALARAYNTSLVRLLGGEPRPIPAYNSCGLGIIGSERAAAEAQELAQGFSAIKVRLGYSDVKTDVEVVRAVRRAVGDGVRLMSDYNQSLSVPEAINRAGALDDEGLEWIEEPTLAGDYTGHAQISRETKTPIQIGENWWGPHEMAKSIAAVASDLVMPDAMKIGGVSGWMRAASLAETAGLPLSSHLFPEISVHLLSVTPTCHWLEYVDWANPILQEPVKIQDGHAINSDAHGIGISWDEDAVKRYLIN